MVKEGEITEDGAIVYFEDDVNICTDTIEEQIGHEKFYFIRTAIIIENSDASHEYTFSFDLPFGYSMITADEYNSQQKAEILANKEAIIERGMTEKEFSDFLKQFDVHSEDIYIVDSEGLVRQYIEAPWAKDSLGKPIGTRYIIRDNNIIQVVDFDESSNFPIIADPKVGATKPFSFKISNTAIGIPSVVAGTPISAVAKNKLKKIVAKKIGAAAGSKLIPGINIASWVLSVIAAGNSLAGNNGFKIYGTLIYKKSYLQKEGYHIYGWDIKSLKIKPY